MSSEKVNAISGLPTELEMAWVLLRVLRRIEIMGMATLPEADMIRATLSHSAYAKQAEGAYEANIIKFEKQKICVWNDKGSTCTELVAPELLRLAPEMTYCPFCCRRIEVAGKAEGSKK